jgi:hypothetical protein
MKQYLYDTIVELRLFCGELQWRVSEIGYTIESKRICYERQHQKYYEYAVFVLSEVGVQSLSHYTVYSERLSSLVLLIHCCRGPPIAQILIGLVLVEIIRKMLVPIKLVDHRAVSQKESKISKKRVEIRAAATGIISFMFQLIPTTLNKFVVCKCVRT